MANLGIANAAHCHPPTIRLTQSLSTKRFGMADCVVIPQQFALPKAFQLNASRSVGFFNAHPLNQASLFRGFALKKPLNFVRGLVARPGFEPGTSGL
jgi:hypothetical protein